MKKLLAVAIIGIMCVFAAFGQNAVELDAAIQRVGKDISLKLAMGPRVALLSLSSPSTDLSSYFLKDLALNLEGKRSSRVIPRQEIDRALTSANLRSSGPITVVQARQVGRTLNAQFAVTGSVEKTGANYRITVWLISLIDNSVFEISPVNVRDSGQIRQLLGIIPEAPSPAPEAAPAPAAPSPVKTANDHYEKGKAFYDRNDFDNAIVEFGHAVRLDNNHVNAYFFRGNSHIRKGEYDQAIADYTQAIRIVPEFDGAYHNRGLAYSRKDDYDRAIADYTQAIKLDPDYSHAYFGRGNVYRAKREYDNSIADYNEAIRLDPAYAFAYNNRGCSFDDKKDYDRAIADYTESIRIIPNSTMSYVNRASTYNNGKKDYDRALADYNEAIRIDPNYAMAYHNRGIVYDNKGDKAKADADKAKARELGYTP
ncbi:MAG: tetratricopeptide repeat protein [Treponema sp.]|jgi:tetratricopeptide (TPR) repeat protein|nr:tetratricopeptide repeat protein [Treponema sp.]